MIEVLIAAGLRTEDEVSRAVEDPEPVLDRLGPVGLLEDGGFGPGRETEEVPSPERGRGT